MAASSWSPAARSPMSSWPSARRTGWTISTCTACPRSSTTIPDRIAPAVEAALASRAGRYDRAFVAYADCGTGGDLAALCERLGVEMIEGPHCYAFFDGIDRFAARDEIDAFYLTDFLARQFDAFVTRPLGLDRHPELRDMYFRALREMRISRPDRRSRPDRAGPDRSGSAGPCLREARDGIWGISRSSLIVPR